ncbi:unnamed protein product, partial [Porites evermanni]
MAKLLSLAGYMLCYSHFRIPRTSGESKRIVCSVCSCTYLEGEECVVFEQYREYETSRIADGGSPGSTGDPPHLAMDQTRSSSTVVPSNPGTVERDETDGLAFWRTSGESARTNYLWIRVCMGDAFPVPFILSCDGCIRCEQDREYET